MDVSDRRQELSTLCEHPSSPPVFGWIRVAHLFVCVCVALLCVFMILVRCCDVRYDFRKKTVLCSSLPSVVLLFVGRFMSYCVYVMSNIVCYQMSCGVCVVQYLVLCVHVTL
jgi:hypothetical protein